VSVPAAAPPLRPAAAADLPALLALLAGQHLPTDDVAAILPAFTVAESEGGIAGAIALEPIGTDGLLRSAAVADGWKGRGLGGRLVEHVLAAARTRRMPSVYLLTETAQDWFPRFGFARIARADAPAALRAHPQFTTMCPDSAIVMRAGLLEPGAIP
jgi:amino-acid N-acetyltransferase